MPPKVIFPGSGQIVKSVALTAGVTILRDENYNCIYNGTTQTVSIRFEQDVAPTDFVGLPAGSFIPGRIIQVTAGNNVVGLIIE